LFKGPPLHKYRFNLGDWATNLINDINIGGYDDALNDKIKGEWLSGQLSMSEIQSSNGPPPPAAMIKRTKRA